MRRKLFSPPLNEIRAETHSAALAGVATLCCVVDLGGARRREGRTLIGWGYIYFASVRDSFIINWREKLQRLCKDVMRSGEKIDDRKEREQCRQKRER